MKFPIHLFIVLLAFQGLPAQSQDLNSIDFASKFEEQVAQSCKKITTLHKAIWDPSDKDKEESITFKLDCEEGTGTISESNETINLSLESELQNAIKYCFQNPYLIDYYIIEEENGWIRASVNANSKQDSPLQFQKFIWDENKKIIRSVEARILKNSWFYDLEIDIKVQFDENGIYLSHQQYSHTTLAFISTEFRTNISAKAIK